MNPTKEVRLLDGEEQVRLHPKTFHIPPRVARESLDLNQERRSSRLRVGHSA